MEKKLRGRKGKKVEGVGAFDSKEEVKEEVGLGRKRLVPAWHDPADDILDEVGVKHRRVKTEARVGQPYRNRLIENFESVYGPTPSWAKLDVDNLDKVKRKSTDSDEESEEEDEANKKVYKQTSNNSALPQGKLNILRVLDLNSASRTEGKILRSVEFHPKNPVALVAGTDDVVSLYQVDGSTNAHIQSVNFEKFSISKATFCAAGEEIFVSSSAHEYFYSYDMRSGKIQRVKPGFGNQKETIRKIVSSPDDRYLIGVCPRGLMKVFSRRSKEVVSSLSVNGEVQDVAFTPDGSTMFSYSASGEVCRFDMNVLRCTEKFTADGAFAGSCFAAGSKYIACGYETGFVSVLENKHIPVAETEIISPDSSRKPIRELRNLQTAISCIKLNAAEEILAMGSCEEDNALRLVHLPSLTVFPRFPILNAKIYRSNCLTFSPNSGYLAVGNNRGSALLFRLKHYCDY